MLHVLPVYASPAAPHAHAVMLAASCPVRILPRRVLPCSRAPVLPCPGASCRVYGHTVCLGSHALPFVPMLHVLPVYARPAAPHAHAVMLAASCPVRILPRRACLAGVRAPAAACLPHICLCVCMFTCLHVYMFTCLHVYKLPSEMAYLSAIWNAQRDKQRPEQ